LDDGGSHLSHAGDHTGARPTSSPTEGLSAADRDPADGAGGHEPRLPGRALAERRAGRLDGRGRLGILVLAGGARPAAAWPYRKGSGGRRLRSLASNQWLRPSSWYTCINRRILS